MILTPVLLLITQVSGEPDTAHRHRWQKIERSISTVCNDENRFTVLIETAKTSKVQAIMHNGARVITRAPEAFNKKLSDRQIINADPLGCLGEGGKDGSSWVLSTYRPGVSMKTGRAFARIVRTDVGWDLIIDEISDPS